MGSYANQNGTCDAGTYVFDDPNHPVFPVICTAESPLAGSVAFVDY
jgi:hypothetical protein